MDLVTGSTEIVDLFRYNIKSTVGERPRAKMGFLINPSRKPCGKYFRNTMTLLRITLWRHYFLNDQGCYKIDRSIDTKTDIESRRHRQLKGDELHLNSQINAISNVFRG